jgi:D-serine deaminase-like pyridoxal phosphate-dependent protein
MKRPLALRRTAYPQRDIAVPPRNIDQIETPAPIVDLDVMARNLDRMAAYTTLHSLALRPHIKTHKSPRVAAEQVNLGAAGLTCATPREIEVMSDVTHDLLLAYPPIGVSKLTRLMALPRSVRLTVALDSLAALGQLAAAARVSGREVHVYVELDLGMHRVGVQTPEQAVTLARAIREHPPLQYAGIAFYPGHIRQHVREMDEHLGRLNADLQAYIDALDAAGLPPAVVSGGSTPAAFRMHEVPLVTEVRPGTYVYNDRGTAELGACAWEDCALTVLATVISRSVPGQAVIDAGTKALGREPSRGVTAEGFGVVRDHAEVPGVRMVRMSEEHGILDLSKTDWRPDVGEIVQIIPNHVCVVVHLNDQVFGVRNGLVETQWSVAARGRLANS